ncbi:hypothetical protein GCM10023114_22490 [Mycolicibacterium sediminis]|uniref:Uncharacterized protein n=1 Tax=Mycolicibacterium sediminis TaxID=1286180 RepID=A0A7I7QKV1_9MYCO|nr:hypothetical protein MSEDJ_06020 [Mycolicibacterium sediminis]
MRALSGAVTRSAHGGTRSLVATAATETDMGKAGSDGESVGAAEVPTTAATLVGGDALIAGDVAAVGTTLGASFLRARASTAAICGPSVCASSEPVPSLASLASLTLASLAFAFFASLALRELGDTEPTVVGVEFGFMATEGDGPAVSDTAVDEPAPLGGPSEGEPPEPAEDSSASATLTYESVSESPKSAALTPADAAPTANQCRTADPSARREGRPPSRRLICGTAIFDPYDN